MKLGDREIIIDQQVSRLQGKMIASTPDLDGIQTAWESIPELKARGPVDFKKFVEPRFIEEVLREMK